MNRAKKAISLFIVFSMLFVMIFSSSFIICHSCHACTGRNCIVCYKILVCTKNLTKFSVFVYMLLFVNLISLFSVHFSSLFKKRYFFKTPVLLKVKLLN